MLKEALIFVGGLVTGAAVVMGLDDKDETSWEEYHEDEVEPEQVESKDSKKPNPKKKK